MVDIALTPLRRAVLLALALVAAGPAAADPPAAYGARRAAEVTFRDWRLACLGDECQIRATLRGADDSPVLVIAAGPDGGGAHLSIVTPLPLFLPDGLSIGLGDAPPRAAPWRTCDRAGCSLLLPLDAELLASLRRERIAEIGLTLVEGVRVRLPASLLGFTAAWRALEARRPVQLAEPAPEPERETDASPEVSPP